MPRYDARSGTSLAGYGRAAPLVSLSIALATPDDAEAALLTGQADLAAIFNLKPRGSC